MQNPVSGEKPQIDWPVVTLGNQRLVVRWTFYAQWLLSKRKVPINTLPRLMQSVDPSIVEVMVECFAAAVAENFTSAGKPAPDPEYWARAISELGGDADATFREINSVIWDAVGKAQRAANPAPQSPEMQTGTMAN